MRLAFERTLACPAEVAWPLLTIPEQMNRWSEAKIAAIAPGADGRHDAVGAKRQVRVNAFGLGATLHEDVLEAAAPERFVYRVTGGGGLRNHQGTIELARRADGGTDLAWQVEFEGAIPGLERVLGAILRPRLARSLDRLVAICAPAA